MHFYCTTDFAEIHCSCGFRGFGQGHRHHKKGVLFGTPFLCCYRGLFNETHPFRVGEIVCDGQIAFRRNPHFVREMDGFHFTV